MQLFLNLLMAQLQKFVRDDTFLANNALNALDCEFLKRQLSQCDSSLVTTQLSKMAYIRASYSRSTLARKFAKTAVVKCVNSGYSNIVETEVTLKGDLWKSRQNCYERWRKKCDCESLS